MGVSGLAILLKLATRQTQRAEAAWRRVQTQRNDADHKLMLLRRHHQDYRDAFSTRLAQGMPAAAIASHLGFLKQIEVVVQRQQDELGELDESCARCSQELVDARREQRVYEILSERIAARAAVVAERRMRNENDDALARAALPERLSRPTPSLANDRSAGK